MLFGRSLPDDQVGFAADGTFESGWTQLSGHRVADLKPIALKGVDALRLLAFEDAFGPNHIDLLRVFGGINVVAAVEEHFRTFLGFVAVLGKPQMQKFY